MEDPAGWPTQTCRSVRERSKTGAIMNSQNVSLRDFGLTEKYFIPHLVLECKIYFVSFDNTTSFCFLLIPLDQSGALNTVPQILLQNFPHSQFHGINHSWISFFFKPWHDISLLPLLFLYAPQFPVLDSYLSPLVSYGFFLPGVYLFSQVPIIIYGGKL